MRRFTREPGLVHQIGSGTKGQPVPWAHFARPMHSLQSASAVGPRSDVAYPPRPACDLRACAWSTARVRSLRPASQLPAVAVWRDGTRHRARRPLVSDQPQRSRFWVHAEQHRPNDRTARRSPVAVRRRPPALGTRDRRAGGRTGRARSPVGDHGQRTLPARPDPESAARRTHSAACLPDRDAVVQAPPRRPARGGPLCDLPAPCLAGEQPHSGWLGRGFHDRDSRHLSGGYPLAPPLALADPMRRCRRHRKLLPRKRPVPARGAGPRHDHNNRLARSAATGSRHHADRRHAGDPVDDSQLR